MGGHARLAALGALVVAVSGCDGCSDKKAALEKADASEAGAPEHRLLVELPGCHPVVPGGSVLEGITPGILSIAALNGKALVASSSTRTEDSKRVPDMNRPVPSGGGTGRPGPAFRTRAESVMLGPTGAPEGPAELLGEHLDDADAGDGADSPRTFPAAVAFGTELAAMSYAVRPGTVGKCGESELLVRSGAPGGSRRALLSHVCHRASGFRAAARGKLGIALAIEGYGTSVDAWLLDGTEAKSALVESLRSPGGKDGRRGEDSGEAGVAHVTQPAVAVGSSSVAAAYVVSHRSEGRELHVARLGAHGEPASRVEILEKDKVESVTLAFDDDTLHVVWSLYVPEKRRHVLRWSKWPAGGAPTPPQSLGTGVLSATKPALAIDHGRFLLAWTEGDESRTTVKVGASRSGIAAVFGLAAVVSTPDTVADYPVVAMDGSALFIAWNEHGPRDGGRAGSTRATALRCLE
jgi:hypothetical protein